ncbi:MAG: type IV pilus modification protein PilV [Deltaproteobacteria bacterium]|nr:type IV pilus modification protein PilV [Deltaproteobacteria bacterium]MBW2344735.1 type IV pilus modification protein PilV [Deltaproteobacteria bacterium]
MKKIQSTVSKKNGLKHQSGFTLIEVLVGITILTIGLLGVAKMQISAIRGNFMSSSTTAALALAQEKMEELMVRSYTDAELADSNTGNNPAADALSPITSTTNIDHQELDGGGAAINIDETGNQNARGQYHRIWNIADHPVSGEDVPTMKSITVIVTWEHDKHKVFLSCFRR